jgi:magnesium-transporting ATPase (P-type)
LFLTSFLLDDDILKCREKVYHFASQGFRSLVVGYRKMGLFVNLNIIWFVFLFLDFQSFYQWLTSFEAARVSVIDREKKVGEICEVVEKEFVPIGVTSIVDEVFFSHFHFVTYITFFFQYQLQDGVADTIKTLRKAGIRVWMLTGDHQATARQIGFFFY